MGFPECIRKRILETGKQIDKILKWREAAIVAEKAKEEFPDLIGTVSVGIGINQVNGVLLHCHIEKINDVVPLLGYLAKKGFRQKDEPNDYAEIQRRTWDCGDIKVMGFLRGQSCRYVEVGKKEEPIYELRCD